MLTEFRLSSHLVKTELMFLTLWLAHGFPARAAGPLMCHMSLKPGHW